MTRWRKGEEQVTTLIEQKPGVPGLTSLDRLRRRRNQAEYPNPANYDPITTDEAEDAIKAAIGCLSSANRLLQLDELGIF